MGYSEVDAPSEDDCPFAIIVPQSQNFGDEIANDIASLLIVWAVTSSTEVTDNDATELQGLYDTDALGRLIWGALDGDTNYRITQTEYTLDGVGTEVFPGSMELTVIPLVADAYYPNKIKSATIYPVSSESSASTVYGTGLTVADVSGFSFTPRYLENNVTQGQAVLCSNPKLLDGDFTLELGAFQSNLLSTLLGGSSLAFHSAPGYFKLVVVSECPDGSEITETLHRCKVNKHSCGKSGAGGATFSVSGKCIKLLSSSDIYSVSVSE